MSTYLNHITLDTGHTTRSRRAEAADEAIATIAPHLRHALEAGADLIPTTTHYGLKATAQGAFLLATIMAGAQPLLTFGVAPRSRGAAKLWSMLIEGRDYPVDAGRPPQAPWLAVRVEPGVHEPDIEMWMPDYERLVAWAWIEGRSDA